MGTVALIAASGRLPSIFADELRRRGHDIVVLAIVPSVDARVREAASHCEDISVGELQRAIDTCKRHSAAAAVFAGKFEKSVFCAGVYLDDRATRLLSRLKDRGDDRLTSAVAEEFESEGIEVIGQIELGSHILAEKGAMTRVQPTREEMDDVSFGLGVLRAIGPLDVGQSAIVKRGVVVAVEAVEGTDQAVLRGGTLAGGCAVVVKAAKPGQDLRFDVPTVGKDTIACMHASGCRVLAVEAGSTFIVDKDEAVQLADRHGISIIGV